METKRSKGSLEHSSLLGQAKFRRSDGFRFGNRAVVLCCVYLVAKVGVGEHFTCLTQQNELAFCSCLINSTVQYRSSGNKNLLKGFAWKRCGQIVVWSLVYALLLESRRVSQCRGFSHSGAVTCQCSIRLAEWNRC